MKLIVLFLCALLLQAETKQERGKRIVDEAIAALGGEAFLTMKDRLETGRSYSFYGGQLRGLAVSKLYTKYNDAAPAGELAKSERQSFGKDEDMLMLFLPADAYQVTYRGALPIQRSRLKRYQESSRKNIFYILRMRQKEPGLVFEYTGSAVWQNTPVDMVDIIDAENNVTTVYFTQSTKQPLRQLYLRRDPITKRRVEETTVYAKYRDVGNGVQWPFSTMSYRDGDKIFEMYADSVVINQGLADDLFKLPEGTKVLPVEKESLLIP